VPRTRATHAASAGRRQDILLAALDCFGRTGFAATTMDDILRRSGASTGSMYHHFGSKDELAAALYVEALRDYQAGFLRALVPRVGARRAVHVMVQYHLDWVRRYPDWARYLLDMGRHANLVSATREQVAAMNRDFSAEIVAWLEPYFARGELRRLSSSLLYALVLGPAQYLARQWLDGRAGIGLAKASGLLADAAWRALQPASISRGKRGKS